MSNAPAPLRGTITTYIDAVDAWATAQAAVDSEINPLTAVGPNPPDPGHAAQWAHVNARNDALADRRNEITRAGSALVQLLTTRKEDELAIAVQAVADAASADDRAYIDQNRRDVKAKLRVLVAKLDSPPAPGPETGSIPLSDADCVVLAMLAARYRDGSSVVDWRPVEKVLLDSGYPVLQERRLIRRTLNALTLAGAVEPIPKAPRPNHHPMVIFLDENEPNEWRILPRAVSLAGEWGTSRAQTDTDERAPTHLLQDGEQPHHQTPTTTSVTGTGKSATEKQKQERKDLPPDGPFDPDGFRFAGVEVRFGRAGKQYRLVLALWNRDTNKPTAPRAVNDVITDVWGEENDTQDDTFRSLCSEIRRTRFQPANCPLDIQNVQGKVQLVRL